MPPFRELRAAWRCLIADQEPDAFLTFNLYHALPVPTLHRVVKDFLNRMQRQVDGRNWSRIPPEDRLRAVGATEHPDSNPHMHVAFAAPPRYLDFVFGDDAQPLWRRCHRNAGKLDTRHAYDAAGLAGYSLKDVLDREDFDRMFVYAPTRDTAR